MRASFLDDVSATKGRRGTGAPSAGGIISGNGKTCCRTSDISHKMSLRYVLEYPVDDPDEEDDDDFDEDDEDGDDEDGDEEETETWQVSFWSRSPKGWSLLDFRD
jgi:hypothetical protein